MTFTLTIAVPDNVDEEKAKPIVKGLITGSRQSYGNVPWRAEVVPTEVTPAMVETAARALCKFLTGNERRWEQWRSAASATLNAVS